MEIPHYVKNLISDLENGSSLDTAFRKHWTHTLQDSVLQNIYVEFGFDLLHKQFSVLPQTSEVLSALHRRYSSDSHLRQELLKTFYDSNLDSLTSGADLGLETAGTKTPSGLKNLTALIGELISKHQPSTFNDVVHRLIKMYAHGPDKIKEENNMRRRVYDAINVLIAAGVFIKDGKHIMWSDRSVNDKRNEINEKKKVFVGTLHKFLAIQHLIQRNKNNNFEHHDVKLPFIIVSTKDTPSNCVSLKYFERQNYLQMKSSEKLMFFGDMDILLLMNMHKVRPSSFIDDWEIIDYYNRAAIN